MTASAWGYTWGSADHALQSGALGRWSSGLGACNRNEGATCGSPTHQVDNVGSDDRVLFVLSEAIDITSVRIDPYGTYDGAGFVNALLIGGQLFSDQDDYFKITSLTGDSHAVPEPQAPTRVSFIQLTNARTPAS